MKYYAQGFEVQTELAFWVKFDDVTVTLSLIVVMIAIY